MGAQGENVDICEGGLQSQGSSALRLINTTSSHPKTVQLGKLRPVEERGCLRAPSLI